MKLICGLGNPGFRYRNTRHNVGFLVIDNFTKLNKIKIDKNGFHSLFNRVIIKGEEVVLLKPQTFMNNSGLALAATAERFHIGMHEILVVCDDVNLGLGIIRFKAGGSSGGHKGLGSIISVLGGNEFSRLKVGIGSDKESELKDYVLSGFKASEKKALKEVLAKSADAVGVWLEEGLQAAMNKFNEKNTARGDGGE